MNNSTTFYVEEEANSCDIEMNLLFQEDSKENVSTSVHLEGFTICNNSEVGNK